MLTLCGPQMESLWDEVLPVEVRELPEDLARLDQVLTDDVLLPIAEAWEQTAREQGRPSIAMATFVRLMVIKQRTGWGYETLIREVSDSLHLRRSCLIGIDRRVPEESTVRKLARRLGPEVVDEITRVRFSPVNSPLAGSVPIADPDQRECLQKRCRFAGYA
ncbi:MAG: transposase [Solirubrobacterales bacterium]|nr:transposase [Solirubrobacterales bacterium]